ncbi:MAG TPA: M48 family metalloprotease [Vicinamibacterales bacterium]|jgi:predicted Zn-dependent protease|nr:M48 family metalloprotease [Vicinamibacterales bacterium]
MKRGGLLTLVVLAVALVGCQGGANPHQIIGAVQTLTGPSADGSTLWSDIRGATVDIDEPQEVELGRAITAAVGNRYAVSRNVALTKYIGSVGNIVAATSDRPDLRYYFAVLDSPDLNAFAAPGGYVFITRGALDLMNDEAALAGVLGHEVGHIALKHHGKTVKAQKQKAVGTRFAQAGMHFARPELQLAMAAFGGLADAFVEDIVVKGPSRDEEMESDKVGFQYAARAGYDPSGLREFLATLKTKTGDAGVTKFLSTHPGLDDRLQEQAKFQQVHTGGGKREAQRFAQAMGRVQVQPPAPAPPPAQVQPPAQQPQPQPAPPQRQLQRRQPQRQQQPSR